MNATPVTLGELDCRLVGFDRDGPPPELLVVLCHGFAAPGDDLVPIGGELLWLNPSLSGRVGFVFPAAPLMLDAVGLVGGRAWWMLDIERLNAAIAAGLMRDLRHDLPEGLLEARGQLTDLLEELQRRTGRPMSRIVLGGFSQGSLLATDVSLRLPEPPAALCVWSGTLLCETEWRALAARRGPLTVLQSHGRQDPILPFVGAEWLRDLLRDAGAEVEFLEFDGIHTIPPQAVLHFTALLARLLDA